MLLELTPDRIASLWESIKDVLEKTLPPRLIEQPDIYERILENLLEGKLKVFLSAALIEGTSPTVVAVLIAGPHYDYFAGTQSLLLYVLYGLRDIPDWLYKEDFKQLSDWASLHGYNELTAFVENQKILQFWQSVGADIGTHFVSFRIE